MRTNASSPSLHSPMSRVPDVVGLGGALAGLGGGMAMVIVGMLLAAVLRQDVWLEPKQIAAVVYGPGAVAQPGFVAGPVLLGTLIHFITAAAAGALFGIVVRRWLKLPSDLGTPTLAGLAYGLLLWCVAYFVVLPVINPLLLDSYAPAFIIQHLVYGAVTGLLYTWLRPTT